MNRIAIFRGELSTRTQIRLLEKGIFYLDEIPEKATVYKLLWTKGFGRNSLKEVQNILKKYNLPELPLGTQPVYD